MWLKPKKDDPLSQYVPEENREKPKSVKELLKENPQFYPVNQVEWAEHPNKYIREKKPSALKNPIGTKVKDVPQYHDPEIEKPWFRKVIRDCQPHVHNYRMCLVDEIGRENIPEDWAREQNCRVLGWNLINCASRALCGEEMQNTGWDCYNNDLLDPSQECQRSQASLNSCLSLNKIMHLPDMIPAHITPDSWLWKDFDDRWAWMKETGWGDWKQIIERASRENPPPYIKDYFKKLELDRARRLVWINKRREKAGWDPFTMDDLIEHEKDLDVYESFERDVPDDLLEPTIYP